MAALWAGKPADLFLYTQFLYLKTTPQSDLFQNMLIVASLGTNWYENERLGLVFTKMLVFVPNSGSINSGTVLKGRELATRRNPR